MTVAMTLFSIMESLNGNQLVGESKIVEKRSEVRRKQNQQEKTNKKQERPRHHPLFIIWGVLLVVLLMVAVTFNQTLLSTRFVDHEITHTNLSSMIMDTVDNNLSQYGISTAAISDKEANKLITQAVNQVYSGQEIDLNLQPVLGGINQSASQAAEQYGVELPNSITSGIGSEISGAVNSQLNTPEVKQIANAISIAKNVAHLVMVISLIGLGLMMLIAILKKNFSRVFSWIGLWSVIIVYVLVIIFSQLIIQAGKRYPDYSSLTAQLSTDFHAQTLNYWLFLLVLTLLLFIWRIVSRFLKKR
ncbi:hypothetical protein [Limosilactobacillus fastidiosus]|uniref:hypothetical protein n=1 Tax=Limosilactobacillus fastidiosus TaxID=2759855 RepID=UPI001E302879|nr:hypothetical protein [Limosilactobacillus fastidiosus]MCD7113982.1 hypothetical protein [Limosilactobacillus fastidiosus]